MILNFKNAAIVLFLFLFVWNALPKQSAAQQKDDELLKLTEQLEALQNKLDTVRKQQPSQRNLNDRVKDVGSQLVRQPARVPETDLTLEIRLYDLSDLFVVVPNYAAKKPQAFSDNSTIFSNDDFETAGSDMRGGGFGGGGMGGSVGGGGGVFRLPSKPTGLMPVPQGETHSPTGNMQAAQVTMEQMIATIQDTVKPDLWDSGDATVKRLGNTLLITATETMHSQINNLLNLLREHWGKRRTISIQTFWIRAAHVRAAELLDQKSNDELGAGVVADDTWKAFLENAKSNSAIEYSATLTGHNNQTLHAYSGNQLMLTVGAIPLQTSRGWVDWKEMVAANYDEEDEDLNMGSRTIATTGFAPVREFFHNGVVVQMTPLATRGGNFVILDMQAMINRLLPPNENKKQAVFDSTDGVKREVVLDDASFATSRFSSTIRCPKNRVVLAGSMTLAPGAADENPELLIFVRTRVHTIEEDKSDWKPSTVEPAKDSK